MTFIFKTIFTTKTGSNRHVMIKKTLVLNIKSIHSSLYLELQIQILRNSNENQYSTH